MKLVILTAILATVTSTPLTETNQWPWQVGQEYVYDVNSYSWTKFEESNNNGNSFSAKFIIRVLEPGRLVAKLVNPLYGQIENQVSRDAPVKSLNSSPLQNIDHPFEIFVNGGRVVSLKVPTSLTVTYENLLKGLVSALQVDLSAFNHVENFPNHFDKETFQGLFKKMEADITGNCETLYSVSPSAAWQNTLIHVNKPFEIIKSKNYASCKKRSGFGYGVPEGAVWNGIAYDNDEKQFVKHTTESRLLVSEEGTIYKSESLSSVFVNPLIFGKQKAEVYSNVTLYLESVQPESSDDVWKKTVEYRDVESLLFTYDYAKFTKGNKNVADAQKLLQEMTPLLQDPNNLPKADFLSKFNILIRSIMFMTSEQLTQMTASIEVAKPSKNIAKKNMWIVYRDAVAQAGTIAAFKEIKSWILTKKIEGIEAAAVISSMANILHFNSSKKVMNEFFDFAMSSEVQEQSFLHTTTLLAVTKFIASGDEDLFVNEKVIPRLSQELKQAIENGDKNKAQVYVRVLGNLAHPSILKVFAPYLEGKIVVSQYLRIQMVISLKALANKKNEYVRAVLFSLLKNTAESYEVRVAAALNIFLADPPQEMMQTMGHMTFADPSTQVRAVLANSITFAAGLKDPRFASLAKTAKSVLNMIPAEKFGYRYSTDSLIDDYTSDDELSHFREVSYIGSKNNLLPVYQRGALRFGSTGRTEENWFTLSVSDVQHLLEYISGLYKRPGNKSDEEFKISVKKVIDALNIEPDYRFDLEGSFFLNNWDQQMLLTFTEDDLDSLLLDFIKETDQLLKAVEVNYIKILTQKQVFVTFPLAMGVPFMFDYSEPTALIFQSKAKATVGGYMSASLNNELQFTYARNLDGSAGFVSFDDVYVAAGIINKLQLYFPVNLNLVYTLKEFKLKVEWPEQNANLVHMSVLPYTTLHKIDSLQTVAENPSSKLIARKKIIISSDVKFGQPTGTIFQFEGDSYSSDYKDPSSLFNNDLLTNVRNLLYQKDVALTEFNLRYLATVSQNKAVTLTVFYDIIYNQEQTNNEFEPAAVINDVTPKARCQEIINRVASEIEYGKVQLVDISTVFDGKKKVEFILTGALANSYVDNKVHAALLYKGFQQINAAFNMTKPKLTPLNFALALKNNLTLEFDADFKVGNDDNIHLKVVGGRSEMYKELLLNDPLGKQCLQEISENNLYQKACYKMLLKAHAPDYFRGTLTYKDLKHTDLAFIHNLYELLESWNHCEKEEDVFRTVDDGKLEIEAQAFYYDNYINYKQISKFGEVRLNNVEGLSYYPYAMSFYTPLSSWERARNWYTGYQNLPFCAVDNNKVWTFSGRSYDYSITGAWHVVMVDEAKEFGNELLILARRPEENQTEVYITYKTTTGKNLELILTPISIEVTCNAKEICEDGVTVYYDDEAKIPLVEYYSLRGGVNSIEIVSLNNGGVRLIYDNHRLVVFSDDHRGTTRGICGQSSTEIRDDYMTPYGLVDSPHLYGASFALDGEHADPKTEELKKEAKLKAYQPITEYTNILRSDAEWSKVASEAF